MRILASQADVLLLQQHETWLNKVVSIALLCLHLKRHHSANGSRQQP
ncbi:hypothetical protein ACIBK8_19060 [Streptomyces sp. NPDC050161]